MPNGGYIELIETYDKTIIINGTQRIYSVNTDQTLTLYPALPATAQVIHSGIVTGESNLTYAATNGLQNDITNAVVIGARKTVYTFSKDSTNHLVIKMITYTATGLAIETNRTVTSL